MTQRILIVGAGHAAAQLCASLVDARAAGHACEIVVIGAETGVPYHRPPLSKAFLKTLDAEPTPIRAAGYYQEHGITLQLGDPVVAIDRGARRVRLASGTALDYDALVLATGCRPRRLLAIPADARGVHYLRDATGAATLREELHAARRVAVIGGGFIGLEVAASARALGKAVVVFESAARLLARALSPELSAWLLEQHRREGIEIRLEARVSGIETAGDGAVSGVREADGTIHAADLVLVGVGAEPEVELAQAVGLECDNGVVVDASMRTSDPAILAIGDCTAFPLAGAGGRRIRLESVQNAGDQARCAAATLTGVPVPYAGTPWFWSEQGTLRVQIAGLVDAGSRRYLRGDPASGKFSVLHYLDDELIAVESVNLPLDHMSARQLVGRGLALPPEQLADAAVPLKSWVPAGAAPAASAAPRAEKQESR